MVFHRYTIKGMSSRFVFRMPGLPIPDSVPHWSVVYSFLALVFCLPISWARLLYRGISCTFLSIFTFKESCLSFISWCRDLGWAEVFPSLSTIRLADPLCGGDCNDLALSKNCLLFAPSSKCPVLLTCALKSGVNSFPKPFRLTLLGDFDYLSYLRSLCNT